MFSCTFFEVAYLGRVSKLPQTSKSTKRSARRSKLLLSQNSVRGSQVSINECTFKQPDHRCFVEEFSIYLNYVRKLGFEETPDYDFLKGLFSKVLKTIGETDVSAFDWTRLQGMFLVREA